MPRIIPSGLATWLNNYPLLETHSTLQVALPFSENADTFYYATLPVTIGGQDYRGALKTVGELKLSMGKAADRVEAVLSNEDGLQGPIFFQAPDVLRGNVVKIGRLYFNPQDASTQHHVILFVGVISSFSVDDTDIRLSIVSDLYGGGMTGARRLVSPTCQFKFKDETTCGYVGAATTCDKLFATCEGYNNKHRFGGALFKDSKTGLQTVVGGPPPVNQLIGTRLTSSSTTLTNFKQRTKIVFEGPAGTVVDDEENDRTIVKAGNASIEGAPIQVVYIRPDNTPGTDAGFDYTIDQHVTRASGGFFNTVEAINVQTYGMASDFYASGSAATATASINSGTDQLTFVTSVGDFRPGHGIAIPGARTGGLILYTTILSISGLVATLADNAGATVSNVTVQHDDTAAIQAAYADAVVQEKALFFPAGTYVADTLTVTDPHIRIYGEGAGKTILKGRSSSSAVIDVDNTGATVGWFYLHDLTLLGAGAGANNHGIYIHGNEPGGISISQVRVEEVGGNGIYVQHGFTVRIEDCDVYSLGGNAFDVQGNNTTVLVRCYAHTVGSGKAGYRIRSGQAILIACNGIDSGTNADCLVVGQTVADDGVETYVNATCHGCNFEDFRNRGVWAKLNSSVSLYGTYIQAPTAEIVPNPLSVIAVKFDYLDANIPIMDANCRIVSKGAAWTQGTPIHSNTMPFHRFSRQIYSPGATEITQFWDGFFLQDMPYFGAAAQAGGWAEYLERLRSDKFQVGSLGLPTGYNALMRATATGNTTLAIRELTSQTARPFQYENAAGVPLLGINADATLAAASQGTESLTIVTPSGVQFFRVTRALAWQDGVMSGFAQLGNASESGVITGASGAVLPRLGITANQVQIGDLDYGSLPAPNANLTIYGTTGSRPKLDIFMSGVTHTGKPIQVRDGANTYFAVDPSGAVRLRTQSAPSTPGTGTVVIYPKDKAGVATLYYKKDDGTEVEVSPAPNGTATYVTYWSDSTTQTGSPNFTFNPSTLTLSVNNLRVADGSASAPTLAFINGSSATGFFRSGAGRVSYSAAGTEAIILSSGGIEVPANNTFDLGTVGALFRAGYFGTRVVTPEIQWAANIADLVGTGSPEGVVAKGIGSTYRRLNGAGGTTLYIKESGGTGNTGWVAVASSGSGANAALSNLAGVAVNASLIANSPNALDLGSASVQWRDAFVGRDLSVGAHIVTSGGTPSVTTGIGAGSGASAFIVGNDIAGLIQLTCGPSPAINSTLLTVTFAVPYSSTPKCVTVTAANSNAGNHVGRWFTNAGNTTTTQFALRSGTTALASAGVYQFYYEVKG